ncbi:BZIP transcription factor [Actinidia chinensis var. chinensis]|uniref:BZIP transcription factor n=1 Tax=Actinidia chinensis var. chinensis TaxID=1590841 RepID=A0A2R6R5C3_ACTCC|nr:BZIP transcription factor [Actinidia chinensis var. chinensis]
MICEGGICNICSLRGMIVLHGHAGGHVLEFADEQDLVYGPQSLPEDIGLRYEPLVLSPHDFAVVRDNLELVHELPFLDSEQVHLVPQVLQVFLFSHPGPPRRLPVRYHPPKPSVVHNRAVPVRVVGIVVIVVIVVVPRTGVGSDGVWVGVVWTGVGQDWFLGERGRFLGWESEKRFLAIPGGKTALESREWDSKESVVGWHGGESRQHGRKTAYR